MLQLSYLDASKLANQLILLNRELLQLGGKDSVGEVEPTKLAIIVQMVFILGFIIFFIAGAVTPKRY